MADASHSAAELTVQEYITHHLSFLTFGKIDGSWTFAHTPEEAAEMGFWAINVDTFGWSLFLGAGFLWFFYRVGRTASVCLLYTSPSPRDKRQSRMPSSA